MSISITQVETPAQRAQYVDDEWQLTLETVRPVRYTIRNVAYGSAFDPASPVLATLLQERQVIAVVDNNVFDLYGPSILDYLARNTRLLGHTVISGAESHKNLHALEHVCHTLSALGLDRNGVVVAIGGGVVLDTAGTAAAMYRRGVRFLRVPTTLVGAVDVAVGIKQGINFENGKNLLGAFYPPIASVVDCAFFQSLGEREIACGIAEIVKMGIVRDSSLFSLIEDYAADLLRSKFKFPEEIAMEAVVLAQAAMMDELEPNLYEDDLQRLVDFGHTFSPALESASHYTLPHGDAVAVDMGLATAIAAMRGLCNESVLERLYALYEAARLPRTHDTCTVENLCKGMAQARRHRAGDLNMVVPTCIGAGTFVQDVAVEELEAAMQAACRQ